MFIPRDRREIVFWTTLGHDLKVESQSCTGTHTGEDYLVVDVANLDQSRYFGDEEDITFKEEEIALKLASKPGSVSTARRGLGLHLSSSFSNYLARRQRSLTFSFVTQ